MFKYGHRLLVVVIICAKLDYSKAGKDGETAGVDATENALQLPEGHPQNCKFLQSKDGTAMYVLGVLPGIGWDNLRNVFMDMVVKYDYRTCTLTEDEHYLLPDGIFTIPIKESKIDISAEVFEQWTSYKSAKSASINAQVSVAGIIKSVSGSFSAEVQANKQRQATDDSITTRIQLRHRLYRVIMGSRISLSEEFKARVIKIGNNLANGDNNMAAYLSETLVRDYGTHVLTRVDAGAVIMQEFQIKRTTFANKESDLIGLKASATASFLRGKVSASLSANAEFSRESSDMYTGDFTDTHIESYGGPVYKSNMDVSEWEGGIRENLVAIDKAGEPLHTIITNGYIEELPPFLVRQVSSTVKMAIYRYYMRNRITGCTNSESSNFNFLANTGQQDLCTDNTIVDREFKFGGAFTRCNTRVPVSEVCDGKNKNNPFTGDRSCPVGFTEILISKQEISEPYFVPKTEKMCTRKWLKTRCKYMSGLDRKMASAQVNSYWCASNRVDAKDFYFGGMYTRPKGPNPITGTSNCPQHFMSVSLGNGVNVCISDDDRAIPKVKFGGIFTCKFDNPFVDDTFTNLKQCPNGYISYLATVTNNNCRFNYCMRSGNGQSVHIPTATQLPIRPPYTDQPEPSANATNIMLFMDDVTGDVWMKDESTHEWAKYGMKEEIPATDGMKEEIPATPGLLVDNDQAADYQPRDQVNTPVTNSGQTSSASITNPQNIIIITYLLSFMMVCA